MNTGGRGGCIDRRIAGLKICIACWRRFVLFILIITGIYTVSTISDFHNFTKAGMGNADHHSFDELIAENPDTAAWIRMDNTNIDHPVVKGQDNFEYLSLDFNRNDYAGGCIFLDENNSKDLSDKYIIIHGHNMAGGAMFGDLAKYLDERFFEENTKGALFTPGKIYELTVAGAAEVDAYLSGLYYLPCDKQNLSEVLGLADLKRDLKFEEDDKLVVLSTCSGSLDNLRTVVFCRARYTGYKGEESHEKRDKR